MIKHTTGWIVLGTLVSYLLSAAGWLPLLVPTLFAWLANLLLWPDQGKSAHQQSLVLIGIGCCPLLYAASQGQWLGWQQVLACNVPLLAMFVALSFLGLATLSTSQDDYPTGKKAIATTLLGTHLLGAVINISVLFVFGDRLQHKGRLSRLQYMLLMRSFCTAAWWSPFFVATGVALTYAPGMQWQQTMVPGALMALIALLFTYGDVQHRDRAEFAGYPLKAEALAMPLVLAIAVLLAHSLFHSVRILILISLLAPLGGLLFMRQRPILGTLKDFVEHRLSGVSTQFSLFLGAGVFSSGIKALILLYPTVFSLNGLGFTPLVFSGLSAIMIVVGLVGVHPVVSVAVVAPLLEPLHPDPTRLGFMYLTVWAISTGSSPLSGVGLTMVGRFGASPRMILRDNWYYALAMWLVACLVNLLLLG